MNKQMTLDLPPSPDEPKPWTVVVWRHFVSSVEPFATREDAIDCVSHLFEEDCWVEGVYAPDGTADAEATRQGKGFST